MSIIYDLYGGDAEFMYLFGIWLHRGNLNNNINISNDNSNNSNNNSHHNIGNEISDRWQWHYRLYIYMLHMVTWVV